jgi:ferric-dicitrate binding protein FerR (iron transport regulator)
MTMRNEEAARWFAAVRRGVMSLEERAALGDWLADRKNAAAMAQMERTWTVLEDMRPEITGAPAAEAMPPAQTRAMMFAMACVASICICLLSYSGDQQFWMALDWASR